ncbi:Porphobilinogen deaminase [Paenibacillus sp. P1XP2]|nr:Porphobilinogen deaminase [Paenibacillus sp. P1XP2]
MRTIVVGSRQSALALTQTGQVIDDLKRLCKEHGFEFDFEVKKIVTKGDRILDVTLSKVGGKGLFVKEIEQAMLDGEIDMAVHSMKDMPSVLPEGLVNGAYRAAWIRATASLRWTAKTSTSCRRAQRSEQAASAARASLRHTVRT